MGWRQLVAGVGPDADHPRRVVLLFVAHQLWGSGLSEARAPRTAPPVPGEVVAIIRIPKIDLEKAVLEGVGVEDLKKGPGHYPRQPGNAAIAGHRTTYGAPFSRLDELQPGTT